MSMLPSFRDGSALQHNTANPELWWHHDAKASDKREFDLPLLSGFGLKLGPNFNPEWGLKWKMVVPAIIFRGP